MFTYRGCRKSFRVGVLLTNLSWWKILYLVHYLVIIPSTSLYCGNLLTLLSNETNTRLHIWIICRYTYLRYKVKVWATSENPFAGGRLSKSLPHWEPRKLKSLVCKKLRETVHFPLSPQGSVLSYTLMKYGASVHVFDLPRNARRLLSLLWNNSTP